MRPIVWLFAACVACAAGRPCRRQASTWRLVLVTDVSRSIDDFRIQAGEGRLRAAFTIQQVLDAIHGGTVGAIAVAYVEFA